MRRQNIQALVAIVLVTLSTSAILSPWHGVAFLGLMVFIDAYVGGSRS